MNYTEFTQNDWRFYKTDELYHHGILGQKWGVRRYQNKDGSLTNAGRKRYAAFEKSKEKQIRRVNTMYNRSNMWTERKIGKLEKKGKTAKAEVMKVMRDRNNQARDDKIKAIQSMNSKTDMTKSKRQDRLDALFGGQEWMKANSANMTSFLSRVNEYDMQRGMRWMSNFTLNNTLARMTPEEGYEYLRRKNIASRNYSSGYGSGYGAGSGA